MASIKKAAVIGAGMMGAEIALCFALSEIEVILKDINMDFAQGGKKRIEGIIAKWQEKGKISQEDGSKVLDRVLPSADYAGFGDVDLVVEAALEDFKIKSQVFQELDVACKKECIFATNTSSIPVAQLAAATSRPDKFIGMHFFSPASVMKLVEVIPGLDTSEATTSKVMEVTREIGKEPVKAPDCAGFIVNRLLFAFFNEAWRMVNEGSAKPEDIDKAVKLGLGHPVGIFQMQDLVGLDNALSVTGILCDEYGERFKAAPVLKRKVAAKHWGRKTGKGWYDYSKKGE
jgi:3-hydroxybutyryl-CoA dehydrogenase